MSDVKLSEATVQQLTNALLDTFSNDYSKGNKAADLCYSAHNSIEYKDGQMTKLKAEMQELRRQGDGEDDTVNKPNEDRNEIIDVTLSRKYHLYQSMATELVEFQAHLDAAQVAHKKYKGTKWMPRPKNFVPENKLVEASAIDALLAS